MDSDWDRQWVTICLGIITIASAAVGVTLFSGTVVDVTTVVADRTALYWIYSKLIVILFVVAIYMTMISQSEKAIFATGFELARQGTDRRRSVQHIYQGLVLVVFGLIVLIVLNVAQDVAALMET